MFELFVRINYEEKCGDGDESGPITLVSDMSDAILQPLCDDWSVTDPGKELHLRRWSTYSQSRVFFLLC